MSSSPLSPLLNRLGGWINGEWREQAADSFTVTNPATGEALARLPALGAQETGDAITAAAASSLPSTSIAARQSWLEAITALLLEHRSELARIITLEQGKPLAEAEAEIDYSAGFFRFYAENIGRLLTPENHPQLHGLKGHDWSVHLRPAGVAALITPWNFPLGMLAKKLSAALAAGCPVIIKPAEATPLSPLALCHLLESLHLPAGAINLLFGPPEPIGAAICHDPRVRVISFTGSTEVGRWLARESSGTLKRLSLELGGNAPCLVFADADLPAAIDAIVANKFRCAGQTCVCINRVHVEASLHDRFVTHLARRLEQLKVGNGLEDGVAIGPLISTEAVGRVSALVDDALAHGATRVTDVKPLPFQSGTFFPPTLLTGVRPTMRLMQEEIFGPVIPVCIFPDGDEETALSAANETPYGLAAYAFTSDAVRARRLASRLTFGHVALNSGMGPTPELPFGGFKQSGMGREGGQEGLLEFCEPQVVAERL